MGVDDFWSVQNFDQGMVSQGADLALCAQAHIFSYENVHECPSLNVCKTLPKRTQNWVTKSPRFEVRNCPTCAWPAELLARACPEDPTARGLTLQALQPPRGLLEVAGRDAFRGLALPLLKKLCLFLVVEVAPAFSLFDTLFGLVERHAGDGLGGPGHSSPAALGGAIECAGNARRR